MHHSEDRRRLLLGAASFIGIGTLATTKLARAFETEPIAPSSDVGLSFAGRCGPASEHAGLLSVLQRKLAADASASSMSAVCPICGCSVTANR
jgi:hypothetical protein